MLKTLLAACVLFTATGASAGWRADCRRAARECRMTHGATLTTTTIPHGGCPSQNCQAQCVFVDGQPYVYMFDALDGSCSLPRPPDCDVCSAFCSSTTTTTSTSTTTGP